VNSAHVSGEIQIPAATLVAFKSMIRQRTGLIFEGATEDKLTTALLASVPDNSANGFQAYYQRLKTDAKAFERLLLDLTINETFFFREPNHLKLLTDELIPGLRRRTKANTPIKIMSVGCSTGEEPYSIAMALHERFGPDAARSFQIVAGDIDNIALEKARQGKYRSFSFRGVDQQIIQRYFKADDPSSSYIVKPYIRQMVRFEPFNLLSPENPLIFSEIDIMFYRNVSIYFDQETRKNNIERLNALLQPDGALIMGSVETLANDFGILHLTSRNAIFFFSKSPGIKNTRQPSLQETLPTPNRALAGRPGPMARSGRAIGSPPCAPPSKDRFEAPPPATPIVSIEKLNALILQERWQDATRMAEALTQLTSKDRHLYMALIAMNQRRFDEAQRRCKQVLDEDEWSLDAQIILGLTAKYQDDFAVAAGCFKRGAYIDNGSWLSQYHLADCLRHLGQAEQALRVYSLAVNLVDKSGQPDIGQNNEMRLPFKISAAQVKRLSNLHMANLRGSRTN